MATNPYAQADGSPQPGKMTEWRKWQEADSERRLMEMSPEARKKLLETRRQISKRWQAEQGPVS